VNFPRFLPVLLSCLVLSCDRDGVTDPANSSKTVTLAPRIVLANGQSLPVVDSVRIVVLNDSSRSVAPYYSKSVAWNLHADTIEGIPKDAPLLVEMSGVKIQVDGSLAVWWSGSATATFGGTQTLGVASLPVPVAVGDTTAPVILSRTSDTIQSTDSTLRMVWKLREDSATTAVVDGDTVQAIGDSVVWTKSWVSGSTLAVLAKFRDNSGNVARDSFLAIRRGRVAAPGFSVGSGTYSDTMRVAISDSTAGAQIQYSLDTSATWTSYSGPLLLGSNTELRSRATKPGLTASTVSKVDYFIQAGTPSFTPPPGTFDTTQRVAMATTTPGAGIHYTLDGSAPTDSSPLYSAPISVGTAETIKAIATKSGLASSAVDTARYAFDTVQAPAFSPAGGSYDSTQSVSLSTASGKATIYYTTDGSLPSASSTVYTGPILVGATQTVQAVAIASGLGTSQVSTASYTIKYPSTASPPLFSPAAGSYTAAQTVSLTSLTANATIYYTTDSTAPTTSSTPYSGPITVSSGATIRAIAVATGLGNSTISTASYLIGSASAPTFSPAAGSFPTAQTVILSSATAGATIYYTTDGTLPTNASTKYAAAVTVSSSQTLQAIAVAAGVAPSPVAVATYVIGAASAPTFAPAAGAYADTQTVVISTATAGATIYYTTDGSVPTATSIKYTGPISVSSSQTIRAIAMANGISNSSVTGAAYVIGTVGAPSFSPGAGTYASAQAVILSSTTPGATIYYTTDGSTPTTSSTKYTGAIAVASSEILQAIATAAGGSSSFVSSASYVIGTTSAPTFSPSAGTYTTAQSVTISSSSAGATIYYTTDGTAPNTSSAKYSGPITVSAGETIQAIATAGGLGNSSVDSAVYVIGSASAPAFSVAAGTYSTPRSVALSSSTPGATIYYTTNGNTPTTGSTLYTGLINVTSGETIQAIAVAPGMSNSSVASAAYVIGSADAPTFSPTAGSYPGTQSVTLSSSSPGAVIYYTVDGSLPTTSSKQYTSPISVTAGETIKAIAVTGGTSNSTVSSATYLIGTTATPVFTPPAGSYGATQFVAITSTTPGSAIYYTTDGSLPTTNSTKYGGLISVASGETIQAVAMDSGMANSAISSAAYVIGTAGLPVFSPAGGTFTGTQTVTITSSTPTAAIYYTTDGTPPTTSSFKYSGPISVAANDTLRAFAVLAGMSNSAVSKAGYSITAVAPTFSVAAGTYASTQSVALSTPTPGATIYYTTDGSAPTATTGTKYIGVITVSSGETINAIAVASGTFSSLISSAAYSIGAVSPPTFNPVGGTTTVGTQYVNLGSATTGATIYYTTNGSTPNLTSQTYTGSIPVTTTQTIKAFAVATGMANSAVDSATYTIDAAAPTFAPAGNSYTTAQTVTLTTTTSGAIIYYTTNGTTPNTGSTLYNGSINVAASETIKAIASAAGMSNSAVSSATYLIGVASTPIFNPGAGSYTGTQSVAISTGTSGATIYYTTDGTTPTVASLQYTTTPISVTANDTIKAIAVATGLANSPIASAGYAITSVSPTFTPNGGTFSGTTSVSLATTTPNAAIYYTTDGTTPTTTTGTKYNGALNLSSGALVKAIAVAPNTAPSLVSSANFVIGTASAPAFNPIGGSYTGTQNVTISSATTSASIYYTTDGITTPTTGSIRYNGSIPVTANETIKAIAIATGMSSSTVSTGAYLITAVAPTFSLTSGTYQAPQNLTLSSSTPGAIIYYTTDGSIPTTTSTKYNGTITGLNAGGTFKAIAVAPNTTTSLVSTASYTIGTAGTPAFSLTPGPYTGTQTLTLSNSTAGDTIHYTTDGTTPTSASPRYTGAITVDSSQTINAIAMAAGMGNSSVSSAAYTIIAVAPTFSLTPGIYPTAPQSLTLSTSTPRATIYYTTNGSTPITASTQYIGTISLNSGGTFKAIAVAPNTTTSLVSTASYTIGNAGAPTFGLAGGTYTGTRNVTLSSTPAGDTIHYTTDGTTPTSASPRYTGAITVDSSQTINAIAMAAGMGNSSVSSVTYTIVAVAPTFSLTPGIYPTAPQSLTLTTTTPRATIYYTTNGNTPTTSSTQYTGTLSLSSGGTFKAIAVAPNTNTSSVSSATYTIGAASAPTFSLPTGTDTGTQIVSLSSLPAGDTIHYTTDGSTPTSASPLYSGPITVDSSQTINAIAMAAGMGNSSVSSVTYTIVAVAPTFSLTPGIYPTAPQSLTLTTTTPRATIYYTTNGNTPTTSSTQYIGTITLDSGGTFNAIAVATNTTTSLVSTASYTVGTVATPVFSIPTGSYASGTTVSITSPTQGAIVYYTTDGSTPTSGSPQFTGPITPVDGETIMAIAIADGMASSAVSTATYTITQ
jgi:hypothetical protein